METEMTIKVSINKSEFYYFIFSLLEDHGEKAIIINDINNLFYSFIARFKDITYLNKYMNTLEVSNHVFSVLNNCLIDLNIYTNLNRVFCVDTLNGVRFSYETSKKVSNSHTSNAQVTINCGISIILEQFSSIEIDIQE